MRLAICVSALLTITAGVLPASAKVKLPFVFTHHMVLQRGQPAPVWGKADPGESVTVRFDDQEHTVTANASGAWKVTLDELSVGEARELRVQGADNSILVRDILVGDVWICSGQSNMAFRLQQVKDGQLDALGAKRNAIRLLKVEQIGSQEPLDDIDNAWTTCTPDSAKNFSAVGYHFGTQLQESLGVPIGLIQNAWGGSACEAWLPRERLLGNELYQGYLDIWAKEEKKHDEPALRADYAKKLDAFYAKRDAAYAAGRRLPGRPSIDNPLFHQHRPANLYNARVMPLVPFAIKGVIWYQGESNASRALAYRELFPATIQAWRDVWGQGDFPFYWVQLADFGWRSKVGKPSNWAELREAQTMTLERLSNVGQAVAIDLGETNDIHPRNKRDVGLRLARLALSETYGLPIKASSPRFSELKIEGNKALVTFEGVGGGLRTFDGVPPVGFALAGENRQFYEATAKIVGKNRLEVVSEHVAEPVAVRYAWADNPPVNLYDSKWLPVTPFRTDDWRDERAPARK